MPKDECLHWKTSVALVLASQYSHFLQIQAESKYKRTGIMHFVDLVITYSFHSFICVCVCKCTFIYVNLHLWLYINIETKGQTLKSKYNMLRCKYEIYLDFSSKKFSTMVFHSTILERLHIHCTL